MLEYDPSPEILSLSDQKTVDFITKNTLGEEPQSSLASLDEKNNSDGPFSEKARAANHNATLAAWNEQQKSAFIFMEFLRTFFLAMFFGQFFAKRTQGAVDDSSDEDDEIAEEQERARQVQEIVEEYKQKYKTDAAAEEDLKVLQKLLEERDELVEPLLEEWEEHKRHQIDKLAIAVASSSYKINGKPFILNNKDIRILNKVAKPQEVWLKYPALIPQGGFPNAQHKSDSNLEINLVRIATAKLYTGEHTLALGKKAPLHNAHPDKQIYVHFGQKELNQASNQIYYTVQDAMGDYISRKIAAEDMHDVHFAAVVDSLTNPSKPLLDEAKRALFEVTAKQGYKQKLEADDVQSIRVFDSVKLDTELFKPTLKPFFEKSHKEDAELEKKQEAAYAEIRKKNAKIEAHLEKSAAAQELKKDVLRAIHPEIHGHGQEQALKTSFKTPELKFPSSNTGAA